ncbi:sialate O-acetylesterase [candidate division KSB1 bacterium]|nr:sialate O-acetylesterase [candidate division KSB1 bacterium]
MKKSPALPLIFLVSCFVTHGIGIARVTLPAIFNDHMVLQQNSELTLWGWAKPREKVTIISSWNPTPIVATANNHADWSAKLSTPTAGGPHTLTIIGSNTIVLQDILIGEVWLCSGQSNMEWSARAGIDNGTEEVLAADYPAIRLFQVTQQSAATPQLDCNGEWIVCSPQTMIDFSAIGYFFGRELCAKLNVPIGLINSSWGGTPAETWMNPQVIEANPELKAAAAKIGEMPWCPEKPGEAYYAMIKPLIPFPIAGVIWYQGESNTETADSYDILLTTLIRSWRDEWGVDFPFYYVQIAPYKYGAPEIGVKLREAQRKSLTVPNTGMVVVSDIGNINDIHPRNKKDVGIRLANWALAKTYGVQGVPYSGPLYRDMKIERNKIRLFFDHAESGLVCRGDELTHFEIAGENGNFVTAEAKIDGQTVLVQSRSVNKPVAVRFAWDNIAEPNLFNGDGLPASCFRTDD